MKNPKAIKEHTLTAVFMYSFLTFWCIVYLYVQGALGQRHLVMSAKGPFWH